MRRQRQQNQGCKSGALAKIDDQPADDTRLTDVLRSSWLPVAPGSLLGNVQRRIKRRVLRQRGLVAASAVIMCMGIGWLIQRPNEPQAPTVAAAQIDDELLASLFALPPVDSLAVLDRRQQLALQTLRQLEKPRP